MGKTDAKWLPQLIIYDADNDVKNTVRGLKKIPIENPDQIINMGIKEYKSVSRLDGKAFQYIVKDGQMFLAEHVFSMGGVVADTVLTPLGEFTAGADTEPDFTKIIQIKDAKARLRRRQLYENERIAKTALARVNAEVKNPDVLAAWQKDLTEIKRFIRLGKPDRCEAQMEVLSKYAGRDDAAAKIIVDYNEKIRIANEKWQSVKLHLKKVKSANERTKMPANDGIGKIDPKRREEFEEYYQVRAEQMEPYITNTEETEKDLQPPPTIIYKAKPKEKPEQSNRHFAEMRKPLTEFTVLRNTEQKVETQSNTQISRQI